MSRTSTARQRLLDAACALIHTRGYGAVGVAEICAMADVRKGSFYHFFDSKQHLTLEVIDAHWRQQREAWQELLSGEGPALEHLRLLFAATATGQREAGRTSGAISGCLLANLALELSTQDRVVQSHLKEIFGEQFMLIEAVLREAAGEGRIPAASANRAVARAVVAQMEGMILFAKLGNDPDVLDDLWEQTLLLVRAEDRSATA